MNLFMRCKNLACNETASYSYRMTSMAAKLIDDFKALPLDEQLVVRERVISLTEKHQLEALDRLAGSTIGQDLLAKLIAERTKERARE